MKKQIWMASAAMTLVALWATTALATQFLTQYNGVSGSSSAATVAPAFAAVTATHVKEYIDFDNDGFVFSSNPTPIPSNYYSAQGVTLLNLDARNVGSEPWTHSPTVGAWHTGFDDPITTPYSFVFLQPVASFGLFANDLEATITVTAYLTTGTETFTISASGGANICQFHGFAASSNIIQRIDFTSSDYHIIDDIQFGRVPEPGTITLLFAGAMSMLAYAWRRYRA